jgi:hypothetical protein
MDADHIPSPAYLKAMLFPSGTPKVGCVSAPSICDLNASNSWAAQDSNQRKVADADFFPVNSPCARQSSSTNATSSTANYSSKMGFGIDR